jgi:hypothetical protein
MTNGAGLKPGNWFDLTLSMAGAADSLYDLYAYECVSGRYLSFRISATDTLLIPTLSEWGPIIFGALLLVSILFYVWRRRTAAA